jgi:hypothetical protein
MFDPIDQARTMFHEVNYLSSWLEHAGVPYAMSYMFEEPGYSQSRRRTFTPHWSWRTNEKFDFGTPKPSYLYRFNILEDSHWHILSELHRSNNVVYNVWASNKHPNRFGHELMAKRLFPLIKKVLNTV